MSVSGLVCAPCVLGNCGACERTLCGCTHTAGPHPPPAAGPSLLLVSWSHEGLVILSGCDECLEAVDVPAMLRELADRLTADGGPG